MQPHHAKPNTDPHPRPAAEQIVRVLQAGGHVAYFAGGCVRDELLGLEPTDYDVATDAPPDRVRGLFPRSSEVGKAFGVVIVVTDAGVVEVATFRSDGRYSDCRRPDEVRFSTAAEDAARRDFTVNALYLDPFADAAGNPPGQPGPPRSGAVIDLVGGVPDLVARVLRAVGDPDQRLAEDHLRALRAVRLASRLGFEIEGATAAAITRHAGALRGVSRERIGDEVRRMMTHASRARAAALLAERGLDRQVVDAPQRASTWPCLGGLPPDAAVTTALAAWAVDLGQGSDPGQVDGLAARWREALCLSNAEHAGLRWTLRTLHEVRPGWGAMGTAARKRVASRPEFSGALQVLGAVDPSLAGRVEREVRELEGHAGGLRPDPMLTGDDLVAMGFKPGPRFKAVLDGVYEAQLEGRVTTPEEARELARRLGV
jgi:poly(A) polymerase